MFQKKFFFPRTFSTFTSKVEYISILHTCDIFVYQEKKYLEIFLSKNINVVINYLKVKFDNL